MFSPEIKPLDDKTCIRRLRNKLTSANARLKEAQDLSSELEANNKTVCQYISITGANAIKAVVSLNRMINTLGGTVDGCEERGLQGLVVPL